MSVVCFTSLTFGHLPRARVLAETLRAAHPDWALWVVLVDRPPPNYANRAAFAGFDRVLDVHDLGIEFPWLFRFDLTEACAAVKGAMLRHLLGLGAETVVSFDPDMAVFHPLASLAERLQSASILLTPDGGFLAVRNDATGNAFADAPEARPFADRTVIVNDPGWNVTNWNRHIRFGADGGISADGSPLAFCRFGEPGEAGAAHEPEELRRWYARRVAAHAEPGIPDGWWHFASFSDGTPIPRAARLMMRGRPDVLARFKDPFAAEADSLLRWLRQNAPDVWA